MMLKRIFATLFFLSLYINAYAIDNVSTANVEPVLNHGKKWRIGYIENGPFKDYHESLLSTVEALMELGWIEKKPLPMENTIHTDKLWQWLSTETKSAYIEFVADAYWNAHHDKDQRVKNKLSLLKRLNEQQDINLMIAMGTRAGQDIATNEHHTPTIIGSVADPVSSKVIKSNTDSGYEHITARVDPDRYERQVSMFHELIGFKTLGVVYEDSVEGRAVAAVDSIRHVAKQKNFKIEVCHAAFENPDMKQSEEDLLKCYQSLAPKIDALYITFNSGLNSTSIGKLLDVLEPYKIATFAQMGSEMVKHGVLLSISAPSRFREVGMFYAKNIAKIFNGVTPRKLPQAFQGSPRLAINLAVARKISFEPDADILSAADQIYENIQSNHKNK